MQYMTSEERLIALDKMTNTRDLGGYETQEGYYTKSNHYIRASSPANATEGDLEKLYDYGVRVTIDLRSDFEKDTDYKQLLIDMCDELIQKASDGKIKDTDLNKVKN